MWILSSDIRKSPVSNFTEMRPVGIALIHVERQTDVTKEIGSFRDYEKAPKLLPSSLSRIYSIFRV